MRRWRASTSLIGFCSRARPEHLRLGFMVRERPFDRRAAYRYAIATAPYTLESVVLSLADRLATRGVRARPAYMRAHHQKRPWMLAVLETELASETRPPLLRGDEIAALTGASGARIGELVAMLAEEQAAGTVTTREEACDSVSAG